MTFSDFTSMMYFSMHKCAYVILVLVFLHSPLLVAAKPFSTEDECETKLTENSVGKYEEYGSVIFNAVRGDPVDLVLLGTDYLTKCLLHHFPKSQFLRTLNTGLQNAKKIHDTFGIAPLFRVKYGIHIMPSSQNGRLKVPAVAGEYLLLSLNLKKEIPRERIDRMDRDPRKLPCSFDKYDLDGDGKITKSEFDTSLHKEGFCPDNLLFRILSQGGTNVILPETFNHVTPSLHEYMKFEKCHGVK